jgi:hypothetical protein
VRRTHVVSFQFSPGRAEGRRLQPLGLDLTVDKCIENELPVLLDQVVDVTENSTNWLARVSPAISNLLFYVVAIITQLREELERHHVLLGVFENTSKRCFVPSSQESV